MRFDFSSIPPGSTIVEAELTLYVTRTNGIIGETEKTLHRVFDAAEWGEGASTGSGEGGTGFPPTPDSATWAHRFYSSVFWSTPGGDFHAAPSAAAIVDDLGPYSWTSPQLAADVQVWLDNPAANAGWILLGDEVRFGTATRFASREATAASTRPTLRITLTPPCYPNCDASTQQPILNVDDFTCFINQYAAAQGLPHAQQLTAYANCDNSHTAPVLNVDDFTCFINEFAAGCP